MLLDLFPILLVTVFDLHGTERLAAWRQFRETLEQAEDPLGLCAKFWSKAPFVNQFLDPFGPSSWPNPWQLILDCRFDDLAIALGMLYTLKLTKRFMAEKFEIYMSVPSQLSDREYYLLVGEGSVLNLEYGVVVNIDRLNEKNIHKIYPTINISS